MSSAFDKLRRILVLEREQGCNDRAVIGGLDRFIEFWAKQAREEPAPAVGHITIDEVIESLSPYGERSPDTRRQIVEDLVRRLLESRAVAPPPPEEEDQREDADHAAPAETLAPAEAPKDAEAPAAVECEQAPSPEPEPARNETPTPSAPQPRRQPRRSDRFTFDSPVTVLRGVGPANGQRLNRLGLYTVRDVLYHFPRRYDDLSQLKTINRLQHDDQVTIVGIVKRTSTARRPGNKAVTSVVISDGTDSIACKWFNQPHQETRFHVGQEIAVSGRVSEYLGKLQFVAPEWEPLQRDLLHTGRLVPIYGLTEGLSARWMRRLLKNALDDWAPRVADPLPQEMLARTGLMRLDRALTEVHFPTDSQSLARARERLCFDEFLLLQLGIMGYRRAWEALPGKPLIVPHDEIDALIAGLPFELTGAQRRAIDAILADLAKPHPMKRLLQGDVGSGKTVVAVAAMMATAKNGLQAAIMAPTTVLAEQHYRTLSALLVDQPDLCCELLVGSLSADDKALAQQRITAGQAQIIIGTHALIQEAVDFDELGLVIVDEQHRFGVAQRAALSAKGDDPRPHMLAMSATPMPRTLALTAFGDTDISTLDEMPRNRQPIVTAVRDESSRERIYSFIGAQIAQGRQAFVICPLVEESEVIDSSAATTTHRLLQQEIFPHLQVGLLHGRMSPEEKERVMATFARGDYHILVSTAVVEVGIDVPNASIILIEGAERFGLAQLHQFRGRVGRGEHKSYCILLTIKPSEEAMARLRIMEETADGFALAEKDLELRGPGDFLGARQHGLPMLRAADLSDTATLELARAEALNVFDQDPTLSRPEHENLAASVLHFWHLDDPGQPSDDGDDGGQS